MIEFAQMEPPNHEMSPMRVLLKIQKSDPPRLDQPGKWSKEFNDFIAKALIKDPQTRPNADELIKHPFINRNLDSKSIRDLLLEYKADVVEEELVDEDAEVKIAMFYYGLLLKLRTLIIGFIIIHQPLSTTIARFFFLYLKVNNIRGNIIEVDTILSCWLCISFIT